MILVDWKLVLNPGTMNVRQMVDVAVRHSRIVWGGSALSVMVFCWIAWRVDSAISSVSPFPVWDSLPLLYALAALSGAGALLVRQKAYGRAEELRLQVQRSATSGPDANGGRVVADALMELARRERSVWTLAGGPALIALPCALLSADAAPMVPLAVASFFLMGWTFPRAEQFARRAGAFEAGGFRPG